MYGVHVCVSMHVFVSVCRGEWVGVWCACVCEHACVCECV